MKLHHRDEDKLVFALSKREKQMLVDLLGLYPRLRVQFQPISKRTGADDRKAQACQQLLEESLAAQKQENRQRIEQFLSNPGRFEDMSKGCRLTLKPEEVEWLLQVINDIRVGSWYQAGCPDEQDGEKVALTAENATSLIAMEVCGVLEWQLLHVLHES